MDIFADLIWKFWSPHPVTWTWSSDGNFALYKSIQYSFQIDFLDKGLPGEPWQNVRFKKTFKRIGFVQYQVKIESISYRFDMTQVTQVEKYLVWWRFLFHNRTILKYLPCQPVFNPADHLEIEWEDAPQCGEGQRLHRRTGVENKIG